MAEGVEPSRHVVVFDCNVYLDIGRLLGPPFSWGSFDAMTARVARDAVPHHDSTFYDSLRALAVCTSGRLAGDEVLEVWTNAHIEKVVRDKARQSPISDPRTGYCGLGWSAPHAQALVDDLIGGLTQDSNGGTLGANYPDGNPPLDHEDGMVYGACRWLAGEDPLCNVYCVTRDRGFVQAYRDDKLSGHTRVLNPSTFVQFVRAARSRYSMRRMRP